MLSAQFKREYFLQQDMAPAHNIIIVANYLNNAFGNRWLGKRGHIL